MIFFQSSRGPHFDQSRGPTFFQIGDPFFFRKKVSPLRHFLHRGWGPSVGTHDSESAQNNCNLYGFRSGDPIFCRKWAGFFSTFGIPKADPGSRQTGDPLFFKSGTSICSKNGWGWRQFADQFGVLGIRKWGGWPGVSYILGVRFFK